jgi:hypothetical protein
MEDKDVYTCEFKKGYCYHVFSDVGDDWVTTLQEAKKLTKNCENWRIYKETNWDSEEGRFLDEEYKLGKGDFPN